MPKEGAFVDGEQMRIARKRRGLSQIELGKLVGITGASVSNIESGRSPSVVRCDRCITAWMVARDV